MCSCTVLYFLSEKMLKTLLMILEDTEFLNICVKIQIVHRESNKLLIMCVNAVARYVTDMLRSCDVGSVLCV